SHPDAANTRPRRLHLGVPRLSGDLLLVRSQESLAHALRFLRRHHQLHRAHTPDARRSPHHGNRDEPLPAVLVAVYASVRRVALPPLSVQRGHRQVPRPLAPMKLHARLMEFTVAYRLWQAPFAERKLAPLWEHNDVARARRVLDVGCGPGTNTQHFK